MSSIDGHTCDLLVLSEIRENAAGRLLERGLREVGFQAFSSTGIATGKAENRVIIASKAPFNEVPAVPSLGLPDHRWAEVELKNGFRVLGVHVPTKRGKYSKELFWTCLVDYAKARLSDKVIIVGDFNTGLQCDAQRGKFSFMQYFEDILALGWSDAWRMAHGDRQEYSWYSNKGNGFRIDHAFISPALKSCFRHAFYSHGERELKLSDHSPLVVDIEL